MTRPPRKNWLKSLKIRLTSFFSNPEKENFGLLLNQTDYDKQVKYYFETSSTFEELDTLPKTQRAELKMRLMELEEQRKSTRRNAEMLWRGQILTTLTLTISIIGTVIAVISLTK